MATTDESASAAEDADPAVFHDFEFAGGRSVGKKAVGRVGQADVMIAGGAESMSADVSVQTQQEQQQQ